MKRYELYLLVMAVLVALFNMVLVVLGEKRVDAYISITILVYFIVTATMGAGLEFHGRGQRVLTITFIVLFSIVVAYRVWKVLYPGPHLLDIVFGGQ